MIDHQEMTKKDELIEILIESIEQIKNLPDKEIEKRKTKLNTENGTGYYISNEQVHLWLVKLNHK